MKGSSKHACAYRQSCSSPFGDHSADRENNGPNINDRQPGSATILAAAYLEEQMSAGVQEEIGCHKHILMARQKPAPIHTHNDRLWNVSTRLVGSELGFDATPVDG